MTADNSAHGLTDLTPIMDSYMTSPRANPDFGFVSFLKGALRKNDAMSEELTDWLVESWWGLMSEAQSTQQHDPIGQATSQVTGKYTAPDGIDQALLARLMQMRMNETTEELSSRLGVPSRLRPKTRADGYLRPRPLSGGA